MISKENYGKIINFAINVFLGIGLTLTGLYLNKLLTVESFITGFVVSMGVGYTICDIIPAFGTSVTKNMNNAVVKNLISTAVNGFIYILFISFFNLFVSAGFHVMGVWPGLFPVLFLIGYIILLVFMPVCIKLADALTK